MIKQFVHYLLMGGMGTLVHYIILFSLHELLGVGVLYATTAGFASGALVNYFLNYYVTFQSRQQHQIAAPRFFTVALLGMGLNYLIMWFLQKHLGWYYLLAQLFATGVVVVSGYLANRVWSFGAD